MTVPEQLSRADAWLYMSSARQPLARTPFVSRTFVIFAAGNYGPVE
jgi:hypothetical protein